MRMSAGAAGSALSDQASRRISIVLQPGWADGKRMGLLSSESRVRTLRRVLVTYPSVRHIVPDAISLDAGADARILETLAAFLQRQQWLVKSVDVQ
jgi:hypothetical protein